MKRIYSWNWLPVFGLMTLFGGCESANDVGVDETFSNEETAEFVTVEGSIINGSNAAEGAYPFMASLQGPNGHFCGGSLVAPSYILTAAHCVSGMTASSTQVVIGRTQLSKTTTGEVRNVAEILVHPRYQLDPGLYSNDVAVLRLSTPSTKTPIDITSAYGPSDRALWLPGAVARAIGWGRTSCAPGLSDILQQTDLAIMDDDNAKDVLGSNFSSSVHLVLEPPASGSQVWKGDSGGPLLVKKNSSSPWQTAGVTSFGNCPAGEYSGAYTRIGEFGLNRWIKSIIHETPLVGDVDGDGKDDIVTCTHQTASDVWVALSDGQKFLPSKIWHEWWAQNGVIPALGDFNGDTKDDLFGFNGTSIYVTLSDGKTFANGPQYSLLNVLKPSDVVLVGDVTGDKKDDVVIFTYDTTADVYVLVSTGTGFLAKKKWHDYFTPTGETPMLADVNGDGKEDVITFTQGMNGNAAIVGLSTGSSFGLVLGKLWNGNFAPTTEMPAVGYFNKDPNKKYADILRFTRNASKDVYVGISNGTTAFGTGTLWEGNFGSALSTLLTGDVDGNGLDDILEFTQNQTADVFVSLNLTGAKFELPTKWHDYFAP